MKAKSQPMFLEKRNVKIENVWEVRLALDVWNDVQYVAQEWNTTYSWIVRYCVFRLARRKTLRMTPVMEKLISGIKERQLRSNKCHRHTLCLYGEDEKMLRLVAMQLEITVSMLIRIALAWFLPKLKAQMKWSKWERGRNSFKLHQRIYNKHESYTKARRVLRRLRRRVSGYSREYLMLKTDFYWYGIKISSKLELDVLNDFNLPTFRRFYFRKFTKDEWFDMFPQMQIVIPCTV